MTHKKDGAFKMHNYNKYIYYLLAVLAIVLVCLKQFSTAVICAGIALAFDPFNTQIKFNNRPFWQKACLGVHLAVVLVLVGLSFKR